MKKSIQIVVDPQVHDIARVQAAVEKKTISDVYANGIMRSGKAASPGFVDFTRYARALGYRQIKGLSSTEIALAAIRKAAVDPIDTTTGSELYQPAKAGAAYADALRPLTILGRLPYRQVPPHKYFSYITGRSEFDFYGESTPIACSAAGFGTNISLPLLRISGLLVASNTLIEFSEFEELFRREMLAAGVECADRRLLDPTSDTGDGVRPASLTYGVDAVDGSGVVDYADVEAMIAVMITELLTGGSTLLGAKWITTPGIALAIGFLKDEFGNKVFPNITALGGSLSGLEVLTSTAAPSGCLILVDGSEVLVADSGAAEIALSQNAMIDMSDDPDGSNQVSMFQSGSTAFRLVRYINWTMRNSGCISITTGLDLPLPQFGS
jgi:hypothetical protein